MVTSLALVYLSHIYLTLNCQIYKMHYTNTTDFKIFIMLQHNSAPRYMHSETAHELYRMKWEPYFLYHACNTMNARSVKMLNTRRQYNPSPPCLPVGGTWSGPDPTCGDRLPSSGLRSRHHASSLVHPSTAQTISS